MNKKKNFKYYNYRNNKESKQIVNNKEELIKEDKNALLLSQIKDEINNVRINPSGYITDLECILNENTVKLNLYTKEISKLKKFDNINNKFKIKNPKQTNSNEITNFQILNNYINTINESIEFLKNLKPLNPLLNQDELNYISLEHAKDIGINGLTTHKGSDNKDYYNRLEDNVINWKGFASESIEFEINTCKDLIINWILDYDNTYKNNNYKPNRKNLFSQNFNYFGIGIANHTLYKNCLVVDFVEDIISSSDNLLFKVIVDNNKSNYKNIDIKKNELNSSKNIIINNIDEFYNYKIPSTTGRLLCIIDKQFKHNNISEVIYSNVKINFIDNNNYLINLISNK